ncbi:MAG: hypothetical protein HS116_00765 [Planctomycetes bacterium]|nr:hypothetical protein [Planctomycetota bacterium]
MPLSATELPAAEALCADALALVQAAEGADAERLRAKLGPAASSRWSVLLSGLRSVGKSSLVCMLWGDAELLPTAVRDCTQTNTLIRTPRDGEAERVLKVEHLPREKALDFATRDLAYVRLAEFLKEQDGPLGARLENMPAEARLRRACEDVRKLFNQRGDLAVLHDHLSDDLDRLDAFFAFLDAPEYRPGEVVEAPWDERRDHLMGRLLPDGRRLDVGRTLAYRHVELIRATGRFGGEPPELIDTPWIPAFHNARRADLILERAREADLLLVVSLPEPYEPEPWLEEFLKAYPERAGRIALLFNQVDTVDTLTLFTREGFAQRFVENVEKLAKRGLDPQRVFLSCARLPFLEQGTRDPFLVERVAKLKGTLEKLAKLAIDRSQGLFKEKLIQACDPAGEGGLRALRAGLESLGLELRCKRVGEALKALRMFGALDVPPEHRAAWPALQQRVKEALG